MTKQINEQLFDEINQKDQLLSQCKTSITKLFNKHKGGLPD